MKKILLICSTIVLVLFGLLIIIAMALGPITETVLRSGLPKVLRTEVQVGQVTLNPFKGLLLIDTLAIGMPDEFEGDTTFQLETLALNIRLSSLFSDQLEIQQLLIDRPIITYERKLEQDNIDQLKENAEAFFATAGQIKQQGPTPEAEKKAVTIDHLLVRDGFINAKVGLLPAITLPLPIIDKTDIGKGDMDLADVGSELLGLLQETIVEALAKIDVGDAQTLLQETGAKTGENLKEVIDAASQPLKNLSGFFK
jgi:hypothetical protein